MEVKLTPQEDQLCTLLDDFTRQWRESEGVQTSCRIAGGWVRDKLLGMQTNDIDIALTNMMGVTFADRFLRYCSEVKHIPVSAIHKVESNPEQSKHLETAKTNLLGIDLDFVNLRSEEYAENSRIPTQITFGTPLQDALRRDITINSLFYNVHTRSVEDHTGKGLDDLRNGTIRTPLPPKETFMDDPLRVIRCVRFASRFSFDMVPDLKDAARDPEIQKALESKISRERVGEEVDKMMQGRDPLYSIGIIHDLSLFSSIFYLLPSFSSTLSGPLASAHTSVAAASVLNSVLGHPSPSSASSSLSSISFPPVHPTLLSELKENSEHSPLPRVYLACALTPYRGLTCQDKKRKTISAVEVAVREGLKLGSQNHYVDGIPLLFSAWQTLSKAVQSEPSSTSNDADDRVRIGLTLRRKEVHWPLSQATWSTSLLFSLIQDLVSIWDETARKFDMETAREYIERYNAFVTRAEELGLPAVIDAKTILDGRDVLRVLNASPGPWTGKVLAHVAQWQLAHPEGTKEQCEEWLKAEHAAGNVQTSAGNPRNKRSKDQDQEETIKKAKR